MNKIKYVMVVFLCFLFTQLSACATKTQTSQVTEPAAIVGADRDAHGCIGSAGYTWCGRELACVRSWELATQKGFEATAEAFNHYCSSY